MALMGDMARPSPAAQANTAPAASGAPQAEPTVAVRLGDDGAER